ncbi:MAG: NAD(P)(+) transhydrogenase (Re/Si-specific) subunit beta, partial [Rhodothermales bacterium]
MKQNIIDIAYLVSAIMFIYGLKRLQSPATARKGNQLAAVGMFVAVAATLFVQQILTPAQMLIGVVVGGGFGAILAKRVEMTGMPELVAAFNGFGGAASALVAGAEIARFLAPNAADLMGGAVMGGIDAITISLSILIGMVTFTGSFVAFGKLSGRISGNPVIFPGLRVITILFMLGAIASMVYMETGAGDFSVAGFVSDPVVQAALAIAVIGAVLGILLVIPIGGADMPVVVALLNSYSGLAAAATGFVLDNT